MSCSGTLCVSTCKSSTTAAAKAFVLKRLSVPGVKVFSGVCRPCACAVYSLACCTSCYLAI